VARDDSGPQLVLAAVRLRHPKSAALQINCGTRIKCATDFVPADRQSFDCVFLICSLHKKATLEISVASTNKGKAGYFGIVLTRVCD